MGTPKALLEWQGRTLLAGWITAFREAGAQPLVVLGQDAARIAAAEPAAADALLLVNPAPERGQLGSLRIALEALPAATELVLFTPVDAAGVQTTTIRTLLGAWSSARPPLAAPRFAGRGGHPVAVAAELISEFLALPAEGAARDVTRRYRAQTLFVDVDDPGVLRDLDTPGQYEAARREAAS
jgi:molybdenum cofactor cytidylyltransferase